MSKLKQLSISLVLLSCFAVTNKLGAMEENDPFGVIREHRREVNENIERISREGLQENDMNVIISNIRGGFLSINHLQTLIKLGLKKYVNYTPKPTTYDPFPDTCLKAAIFSLNLENVKLLISIGANIDESVIKKYEKKIEFTKKLPEKYNPHKNELIQAETEILDFLLEEKEKQKNKAEEQKEARKRLEYIFGPEGDKYRQKGKETKLPTVETSGGTIRVMQ